MDAKSKNNEQDDPIYRAMFNIPEPGAEPNFGPIRGPMLLLGAIVIPLAILGGIHHLFN